MKEISLLVTYTLKPNTLDIFLLEISKLGLPEVVLNEKGCLEYSYYSPTDALHKDTLILLESWQSKELQQEHLAQPHMKEFSNLKTRYVLHTKIQYLNSVK